MTDQDQKFYITTPIYYVNARPHIGHLYTTTMADIIARYWRLCGRDVFFLTGTDEHGKKVADSARGQNMSPQEFVDQIAGEFQQTFAAMQFTNQDFIRTTQPRHETRVQAYVQQLKDSGDVYLGEYEGWYDEGQEEYVTETNAKANDYKSSVSGVPLVKVKEKNYFFALSKYQDRLIEYIEAHPAFIQPDARRNEVLSRLRDGIRDVAVSRTTEPWGVSMPGDESHSIYVWIDALFNYVTATDTDDRRYYWPADVHLIGKEILWFHAVIWPAMLMSLGKPLYHQLYAHSFWISEGQKMSKSLGNFVDLEKIDHYVGTFGLDAVRYFMATQGPMHSDDADFSESRFIDVYNSELANTLGNCLNRILNMCGRYFGGRLPEHGPHVSASEAYAHSAELCVRSVMESFDSLHLDRAVAGALELVRTIDVYIEQTQPFKLAKEEANLPQVGTILYNCAEAMRIVSLCLWPVLPGKCEQIWERLGCSEYGRQVAACGRGAFAQWVAWGQIEPGTRITQGDALFPRYQVK